jgi:hypothetical protein
MKAGARCPVHRCQTLQGDIAQKNSCGCVPTHMVHPDLYLSGSLIDVGVGLDCIAASCATSQEFDCKEEELTGDMTSSPAVQQMTEKVASNIKKR